MVEAAASAQALIQSPLAGVAERRMSEIVRKGQRLRQVLVERQRAGESAGDLRDLEGMGQARPVVIALIEDKDLGLVFESPKRGRVDDAIAIPPKRAPGFALRLGMKPPAAMRRIARVRR